MATYKVSELTDALLDAAVAECGEWKTAHELFPTMTLDPTFKGWEILGEGDEASCYLTPNNPMRQGTMAYRPSMDWSIGGPIIERSRIGLQHHSFNLSGQIEHSVDAFIIGRRPMAGPTPLIAAMRAYVASKLGDNVDLP